MRQYHPAFDARGITFDPAEDRFRPRHLSESDAPNPQSMASLSHEMTRLPTPAVQLTRPSTGVVSDMGFWQTIFPGAMELLRSESSSPIIKNPYWDIRHMATWPEVEDKLEQARRKYDHHSDPSQVGRLRRNVRNMLDNHTVTMQQATRLVPEVDISKPIVGAIKVVLDAYRQVSETREEIATRFDDLPESFEKIDFYSKTYMNDENILKASRWLLHSILAAMEHAIEFYTSHQAKRAGMAILSGPEYQKALRHSLNDVKNRCNSLESQASMSLAHRITSEHDSMIRENSLMHTVIGSIHQGVQMNNVGMRYFANLFNEVLPLLNGLARERQSRSPMLRTPSPLPKPFEEQPLWLPQSIRVRLRIPDIDEEDLRHVAESTELILHEDKGKAQQVLETSQFRNWMASNHSAKLLIHGNSTSSMNVSALSVFCTLLTHTFRAYGNGFIGLVFFCGRHLAWNQHQGSLVMVQSLITQVLREFSFHHVSPEPGIYLEDVESEDVNVLCDIFTFLIRQLPAKMMVFCLVDGICLYETEEYLHGMDVVILSLVKLVEECESGGRPSFKLLVTSPQPTIEVRQVFDEDQDSLLHMQGLPLSGDGMSSAGLREQLAQVFL
ncbi:hypothetical protein CLIM01_11359 [Colletotrichum limetticola]|uniref:DUF7708 domain-containing protein n=1 Tax=Colletotrichum limetticola TaxID=1209924 RepID=A0ABQ9PH18_9PEZI|nr:hypothetical protein CLIM01_11359 [Colletotrichum limetticola]